MDELLKYASLVMLDIKHIDNNKDFTPIIEKAIEPPG